MKYLGIDLGGTNIAVGLVDEAGKILHKDSVPTLLERGPEPVIKDMANAIEAINSGVTDKYKMIICVATIAEAKQLVEGCPQIKSVNLGNTKPKDEKRPDARQVSRQIFLTAAEEADVREMLDRGVEVEIRPLADDPKVDCASVL